MRTVEFLLLLFCIGALWHFARNDFAEYAAFKQLTETKDRQRNYRKWIAKGFVIFSGTAMLGLAILRRLDALIEMPPEFRVIAGSIRAVTSQIPVNRSFLIGLSMSVAIGAVVGGLLVKWQSSRASSSRKHPSMVGDIEALMPRNWPETAHTAMLSLNAGLSEEFFFRLFLPLLLALLLGNAMLAFVVATLVFGASHMYQGVSGVIATTVLGSLLTAIYLASGSLWIVIGIHAAIDLFGLVVRPSIARLIRQPRLAG